MRALLQSLVQSSIEQLKHEGKLPPEFAVMAQVDRAKDNAHGDFATNAALVGAKAAKMKPRDIAEMLLAHLPENSIVARAELAGPGFINFFVEPSHIEQKLTTVWSDPRLAVPEQPHQTVVVDYSSPNLAKEMHVGHLRSSIIGDAIARTLEFLGHTVIRQNHVGDWGTQFGMLLAFMEEQRTSEGADIALADLEKFYREAKVRFDESKSFAARARELVVALQSGDAQCLALWREFKDISLSHCQAAYKRLGVSLSAEDVQGESEYNDKLPAVIEQLRTAQLLQENEGAQCVFMEEFIGADDKPLPVIVQKAGGGYLYATTDLAAAQYRCQTLQADRIIYLVDQRQELHFRQIFALARKAGFVPESVQLEHMGFGTMNGPDGKPFKTRSGDTVKLSDLLDVAEQRSLQLVREKNPQLDEETLQLIGKTVGISAVKYADLSKNRISDYIFNLDSMLSFEGNTAPYMLYAYTRVISLFSKGGIDAETLSVGFSLKSDSERELAVKLLQYAEVLQVVAERGATNILCNYLYELAGVFSRFYEASPILNCEDAEQKNSRLKLAWLTSRTLKSGLGLLGIQTLERM